MPTSGESCSSHEAVASSTALRDRRRSSGSWHTALAAARLTGSAPDYCGGAASGCHARGVLQQHRGSFCFPRSPSWRAGRPTPPACRCGLFWRVAVRERDLTLLGLHRAVAQHQVGNRDGIVRQNVGHFVRKHMSHSVHASTTLLKSLGFTSSSSRRGVIDQIEQPRKESHKLKQRRQPWQMSKTRRNSASSFSSS